VAVAVSVRREALGLVATGESCSSVARRFGVAVSTVSRWVKAAGMTVQAGRLGGMVGVSDRRLSPRSRLRSRPRPGPDAEYLDERGWLTLAGRVLIGIRLRERRSMARIAGELGVHRSTVKREVDARSVGGHYRAHRAQRAADLARRRPKVGKLVAGTRVWEQVKSGLNLRMSPEQISGRLRERFPGDDDVQVSHETIYQALYVQGAGALRHELTVQKALRQGRTSRRPRSRLPARGNRSWIGPDDRIQARPAEAADRAVPGHWEGDLIIGGKDGLSSALITLVERTTRFLLIGRITEHDSGTVTDRLQIMATKIPTVLWRSLTWDQGVEMAQHSRFTIATGCPVFFCDPHSPWQRPTNENSNGLIREFFPKGTDFTNVTDDQVADAERLLNIRPRKVLGFATPAEKLDQLIKVAMTA
jgi:transposase, IS30 family